MITNLMKPTQELIPTHVRRKANQVADEMANIGTTWTGPELLCTYALDLKHPILQQCIRKDGLVDTPPDGVILRPTRHDEEARAGQQGTAPCEGLVPSAPPYVGIKLPLTMARSITTPPLSPLRSFHG